MRQGSVCCHTADESRLGVLCNLCLSGSSVTPRLHEASAGRFFMTMKRTWPDCKTLRRSTAGSALKAVAGSAPHMPTLLIRDYSADLHLSVQTGRLLEQTLVLFISTYARSALDDILA